MILNPYLYFFSIFNNVINLKLERNKLEITVIVIIEM